MTEIVAMNMGYGHLRAARPLARALKAPVLQADESPLATGRERASWQRARAVHEVGSRLSQLPLVGRAFRWLFDGLTAIPRLHPNRDLSAPTLGVRALERLVRRGLGEGLLAHLEASGRPLLTTFYAPAVAADRLGYREVFCVVTDSDINRVWAPLEPSRTAIRYLAPSPRAVRRLQAYGVPAARIEMTGFPLPDELLGGWSLATAKANLAARLARLDPSGRFRRRHRRELALALGSDPTGWRSEPVTLAFTIGGAGAQAALARRFLPSLRPLLLSNRLRIELVAGVRGEVAESFRRSIRASGLEAADGAVRILYEPDLEGYFDAFNRLMARADVLITKPSELTFFGALGLPLLLADPVGVHERYNARWASELGVGLRPRDWAVAGEWLAEWLADGTLAAAAWAGFRTMPRRGLYRILDQVRGTQRMSLGA